MTHKPPLIERMHPGLVMLLAMIAGVALFVGGVYGAGWLFRTFPP